MEARRTLSGGAFIRVLKGYISKRRVLVAGLICAVIFLLPQLFITLRFKNKIYSGVYDVPPKDFAIVFGAAVRADSGLSDAARERITAAVLLYRAGKVKKIFISGDNRRNREAEAIAEFAAGQGVPEAALILDRLGIDTGDSCRNFSVVHHEAVLVTQTFHLPRSLLMCEKNRLAVTGLAADRLGLLDSRGANVAEIYGIRLFRFLRESTLTWLFLTGLYNRLSNEAEIIQSENAG
jgi:vancomycin permeability regulator SanA